MILNDLKSHFTDAINTIEIDMLQWVYGEFDRSLGVYRESSGGGTHTTYVNIIIKNKYNY